MKKLILVVCVIFSNLAYPQYALNGPNRGLRGYQDSRYQSKDSDASAADSQATPGVVKLSLNDAITLALRNNKDILISNQDLNKSQAQIDEAYGNAYPQVNMSASYQRFIELPVLFIPPNTPGLNPTPNTATFKMGSNNSYTAGLTINQVLFSAKLNTAIEAAKEYGKYSETNAQATREDVELSVKKAYYTVLLAKNVVDVSRQSLDLARANYKNVEQLYKQGMAAEFDYLRSEVQVANTEPAVSQAENNLVLAMNGLKNVLGVDLNANIALSGTLEMQELDPVLIESESKLALERNSNLQGLLYQEGLLEKNIQLQRADYFPSLAAFGQYQYQSQDNTFQFSKYNWAKNFVIGLQLSYPVFNGMQTKYKVEQAAIDKDKLVLGRMKLEDGIRIQVENAKLKMNEAKQRIQAQAKSIETAAKAVSIAEVRFKNGLGTQVELIDAQVALTRTQINKAQAVYDYLVAKSDWERQTGYRK